MIEVKNLTKCYGDHAAVEDLSFTIDEGKIYGFLGPNGAGKSTTMNMLTGCLAATSGEISIGGFDIFEEPEEAKRLIGYLPEIPPVHPDSTVGEYLTFVARAKGVAKAGIRQEVERVMEATKITHFEKRLTKNLSKGYRQRVGIAQALIGSPELIILDEPTVGLDPQQIIEIRELIRGLKGKHTVILSSHILSEVQAVCDEILIINKGRMVACDTTENLEKLFAGTTTVSLRIEGEEKKILPLLKKLKNTTEIRTAAGADGITEAVIDMSSDDDRTVCREVFRIMAENSLPILQMVTTRASLEDIFIELTSAEKEQREGEEVKVG